uniref:Uncharacterized protein n=1 Tax=Lepeophtheirus salmonis TaxID=72036 RepID=A0A0K2V2K6_LEPSM
MNRENRKPIYV